MTAVGFVGLGQIGEPMARRLLQYEGGLVVCDVRPEAVAPFVEAGARAVASAAEVAGTGASPVCVMVRDDEQVREVVRDVLSVAAPGTVIAIHSTIAPETAEELAAAAEPHGIAVLDAPVSGGFLGAAEGTLAVLVGGDEEAIERCRPAFACFATMVKRFGPPGAATRAKVARNLITFASYVAAGEAQRLAEAVGLDLLALGDVVRHSDKATGGPGAVMVRPRAALMDADDPLRPIFEHTLELGEKDLELALALADEHGVSLPLTSLAKRSLGHALGVTFEEVQA